MKEKKTYKTPEVEENENRLEEPAVAYANGYECEVRNVLLSVPVSDMKFLKALTKKLGWTINSKESVLDEFLSTRPENVELSDDEILEEVGLVRYKK